MLFASQVRSPTPRRWSWAVSAAAVVIAAAPITAQAAPPAAAAPAQSSAAKAQAQARSYRVAGSRHANAGRWEDAYAEYAIAWQLSPDWQSASDLGKAAYRTKHWPIAAMRLAFYLREAPAGRIPAKERKELEGWVAEATQKSGSLTVVAAAGAEIAVDGEVVGVAPLPGPLVVEPGKHDVQVRTGTHVETKAAPLLAGEARELRFGAGAGGEPRGGDSAPRGSERTVLRPVALVSGAALTVGGIVAGGVFLGLASERGADKQKAALDGDGREAAKGFALAEAEARNGALWSFVGAGLCAAGTTVLYLTTRPSDKAPVTATLGVQAGGPAITIRGRF